MGSKRYNKNTNKSKQEEQKRRKTRPEGITVVSPLYGPRQTVDRMIFSVLHQFKSKDNPYKINLVLVSDYIEKPDEYDYYISEEFKQFYDTDFIEITLIKNEEHKYQGESREIGFMAGKYNYFLLVDCDDMLAPNACDRYLDIIDKSLSQRVVLKKHFQHIRNQQQIQYMIQVCNQYQQQQIQQQQYIQQYKQHHSKKEKPSQILQEMQLRGLIFMSKNRT